MIKKNSFSISRCLCIYDFNVLSKKKKEIIKKESFSKRKTRNMIEINFVILLILN